jgi:L-fuconolactonase
MPDHAVIDTHLHLTQPQLRYPWMAEVPALQRPWGIADFNRLIGETVIEAMVFVEVDVAPPDRLAEADFVASVAASDPRLRAMVAAVSMDQGGMTAAALAEMRTYPLLRGVRHLFQQHWQTPDWINRPEMIEGVRLLVTHDLTFDLCVVHPQLREAVTLVRECPKVTFVLDHIGKPGIRAGLIDPWRDDLKALAACPNVMCKISGVVTEADHAHWTEEEVAPYITHAMQVFGADRVMFGGDWPVSELATDYPRWVRLVERCVAVFGSRFAEHLWAGNARRIYRI